LTSRYSDRTSPDWTESRDSLGLALNLENCDQVWTSPAYIFFRRSGNSSAISSNQLRKMFKIYIKLLPNFYSQNLWKYFGETRFILSSTVPKIWCVKNVQLFASPCIKKVKFSHTRYRALGPELIPVYRQSARR